MPGGSGQNSRRVCRLIPEPCAGHCTPAPRPRSTSLTRDSCNTNFVYMRNVTVTLEEEVAQWARVWAAKNNQSLSRMLGDLLKKQMQEESGYAAAMADYFSRGAKKLR